MALATTLASLTRSAISVTPNCFKFICFLKYLPVSTPSRQTGLGLECLNRGYL